MRLSVRKVKWRKKNPHNLTIPMRLFPLDKVTVGKRTYGHLNVYTDNNEASYLKIGNYCSLAYNTRFVLDGGHDYKKFSTYPFYAVVYRKGVEATTKGPIIVEDDVWIGQDCLILSGITLGRGCVIGAGSIVTKDIPPYAIYAGGRIVKYRFDESVIEKLKKIDFNAITEDMLNEYEQYCMQEITEENVDEIVRIFGGNKLGEN